MNKAETLSLFIYKCGISAAFFPLIILVCRNCYVNSSTVLIMTFSLSVISAVISSVTPKKYSRYLSPVCTIVLTAVAFLLLNGISLFYRGVLSGLVFLPCILFSPKRESLLKSIYLFAGISFADIIISIVYRCSFSESSPLMLISYMLYAASYGFMVYCKSGADFFRKSRDGKTNPAVIILPLSALVITALLSFPLAQVLTKLFYAILRLIFKNAGGGNTKRPQTESDLQYTQPENDVISGGSPIAKYIFTALIAVMVISFIIYIRRDIAEFFARIPQKIRKKAMIRRQNGDIISCEEYTDYVTYIQPSQAEIRLISPEKLWRRKLKAYRKAEWSERTMRNAIELAQNGLRLCGFEIESSDTVLSIENKLPLDLAKLWHKAALCYMDCRYNGAVPDKSSKAVFDQLIEKIGTMQLKKS